MIEVLLLYVLGIETAFTPCFLPVLPIFLGILARAGRRRALLSTALFSTGVVMSFVVYGVLAALSSAALRLFLIPILPAVAVGLGLLLIALGIVLVSPVRVVFAYVPSFQPRLGKASLLNAFVLGFLFSLIAAPCSAAILVAAFSMVWLNALNNTQSFAMTVVAYALGVATPFTLIGLLAEGLGRSFEGKITRSFLVRHNELVTGVLMMVLGALTVTSVKDFDIITFQVSSAMLPYLALLSLVSSVFYASKAARLAVKVLSTPPLLLALGVLLLSLSNLQPLLTTIGVPAQKILEILGLASRILLVLGELALAKAHFFAIAFLLSTLSTPFLLDALIVVGWLAGPGYRDREHLFATLFLVPQVLLDLLKTTGVDFLVVVLLPLCYTSLLVPALKISKTLTAMKLLEEYS